VRVCDIEEWGELLVLIVDIGRMWVLFSVGLTKFYGLGCNRTLQWGDVFGTSGFRCAFSLSCTTVLIGFFWLSVMLDGMCHVALAGNLEHVENECLPGSMFCHVEHISFGR
jgi:hypothetical protein